MSTFANARRVFIAAAMVAVVFMQGCGGGGSAGPATDDTAASTSVSPIAIFPISHDYTVAGTYELTLTGQYKVTSISGPDQLEVWFTFSGEGATSGAAEPTYALSSDGQIINVRQTLTVTTASTAGAGPWQVSIRCRTGSSTGTLTNLTLHSAMAG